MKRFLPISHTADIGYDIFGRTVEELFLSGHAAWLDAITDHAPGGRGEPRKIQLKADDAEILLVNFIGEMNYLFQQESWLTLGAQNFLIKTTPTNIELSGDLYGETVNFKKFEVKNDVKAVTFHQLEIKRLDGIYRTRLVFDI